MKRLVKHLSEAQKEKSFISGGPSQISLPKNCFRFPFVHGLDAECSVLSKFILSQAFGIFPGGACGLVLYIGPRRSSMTKTKNDAGLIGF